MPLPLHSQAVPIPQPQQFLTYSHTTNTFLRRLNIYCIALCHSRWLSLQLRRSCPINLPTYNSRHEPPENTVSLFFYCCTHDCCSDCLAMAVVYRAITQQWLVVELLALWLLPSTGCLCHKMKPVIDGLS
jgi:hypothetical protein